jgi:hypothetical protein
MSLTGFDIYAEESILVIGEINGAAFTLDAQTVVVETTGLITAEGKSSLLATTRMRSAYEAFLADVVKIHDATTNIYKEVRKLMFSMIMRGDPADVRSVKESSEDLHAMVGLDAQFPAAFDALFLTGTSDDLLETKPCLEAWGSRVDQNQYTYEGGYHKFAQFSSIGGSCFACVRDNFPTIGWAYQSNVNANANGIFNFQQVCRDEAKCPATVRI